jgi:lysophospholipase L1-like esterase
MDLKRYLPLVAASSLLASAVLLLSGKKKLKRALVVGDSHSEASWTLGGRIKTALAAAGFVSKVEGNRGKGVVWYVESGKLSAALRAFKPDLLVVAIGGNDAGTPEAEYKAKLTEFVRLARAAGVWEIVWFGPPKADGPRITAQTGRMLIAVYQSEVLPGLGVEWHDSMDLAADLPTADGVHYASREYATWASRAVPLILDDVVSA